MIGVLGVEMRVHIRLLGGFDVTLDGRTVPMQSWRRRSATGLVKLLALQPGRRLRREQVIDALWPDLLLDEAAPRLHVAAHHARTAVGSRDAVVLLGGTVSLFPEEEVTIDVAEFERAAAAARSDGSPRAAGDAVARYTGDLLPDDLYEPWTEEPRERLRLRYLELLRVAGRYEELVAADPLDEEAQLALVRSHLRHGRRQLALRSLDGMADLFRQELGVEPGPAAVALRRKAEALVVEPPLMDETVVDETVVDQTAENQPVVDRAAVVEQAASAPAADKRARQAVVPEQRSRGTPSHVPARAPLPAPRSRLIGREADLEAVGSLLGSHRIVTITGPGGAGKSTLSLALARKVQADHGSAGETEVILAELAPVRDDADVTRAVAEAAGVQGKGAVLTTSLAANLGPRDVLLVLDNCEHLLDATADLADAVLDAGAHAHILVTSREPLRVDGEAEHRIGSLGPESAQLFVERAVAAAGPGIASVDDPRVVDLCERLDGLPLAIELAAAQLRHLSLQELVDRLDDRLTLLVGGRPKAGERHSALTTTIEWSYRLLSEPARQVFDRLGVFPATFDLAAVEAVTGDLDAVHVPNLLGDLVAKSLVVHDPARQHYRLLETIRLFAARRLDDAGRREEVTQLLRRHVVARSAALPRVRAWLSATLAARSRDDLENVRLAFDASLDRGDLTAAVDIALGLSTLWRNAVSYAEGRRWVAALRERDLSPEDRLWTLILTADVGLGSGDPRMMRDATEEASALSAEVGDPGAAVITAIYEAMVLLVRPTLAVPLLEDARDRARAAGEPGLERVARAFSLVALRLLGHTRGLDDEVRALTETEYGSDYDRYICIWAASLLALVDRDGPRLRWLMDAQLADLMANGLRENWLTMYWEALSLIGRGADYLPQLRRARRRAEAEGRSADADCVLALGYAAACRDDWERAAELLGASSRDLRHDTAGYVHHALLREQLVQPRLDPDVFKTATARGQTLTIGAILEEHAL